MKSLLIFILFFSFNCYAAFVAVLETMSAPNTLTFTERQYITDKLRQIAVTSLPSYMGYTIMTRENIIAMLPPGKKVDDCEGSCLVETGRNISADFIAQARISVFGKSFTETVELYETASGKLMASFTAQSQDAEGLLKEIELQAPSLFSTIKNPSRAFSDGITGFKQGTSFSMKGTRQFLIELFSKPEGAMVSVDGRPKCKSTPCNVQLDEGKHNISFAFDFYLDLDTLIDVNSNEQRLVVNLIPNFGTLEIAPRLNGRGDIADLSVIIDKKEYRSKKIRLAIGTHHVDLRHHCFEPVSFDVTVKNGSELKFDYAMEPAMGGLSLSAMDENGPLSMPVFIDGKMRGKTPFFESVSICSRVEIGNSKDSVPVSLKYHETVEYVYNEKENGAYKDRDGNAYKTIKIGNHRWLAENLKEKIGNSYCYDKEVKNCQRYGHLYSWSEAKLVCSQGWRLPTKKDFEDLFNSVGGKHVAGKMLKSTNYWFGDGAGENTFDFGAIPSGYQDHDGSFGSLGNSAFFWSSTEKGPGYAYFMKLDENSDNAYFGYNGKYYRFSVRCVKDYN
ncbi:MULTISPECIES: FISUMP domain-containing protein [unclassified Fibrobacter]|jgi:uncharacterized protein (TIGR02145 family)|uniref:FISUMP domain-containing protein n=1 Tax=unclassified Fibrobacter TaxID=2634177 RepID=UPI0009241CA8|nr:MULTISPECIES: FISUMP domain-containing protein [unclassified Fibrobacter]SHK67398.1 major paralogous domain-containing protein [Fibrobacter sp. UWB12]SIO05208.1 major paralogous domain-containing protein [Fibrobacter sp. UWB11]